jgi:exopolyphosphatase / guanosine-5'-triphosphate,3'-diphosphate pyrophosphatase
MRRAVAKTLAVVDMGSNAVRLQIAQAQPDGTLEVRAEDRAAVRLGAQVFRTGRLSTESIAACAEALVRFAKLAQTAGASEVRAVATSAVREASNRDELLRAAHTQAGIDIEVVSGAEEARLVCLGVFQGAPASDRSLLVDIGGGSTEIIAARGEEPEHAFSLQLGSVRLSEFFVEHDPISRREAKLIEEAVEDAVLQIDPVLIGKYRRIIGAAGSTGAVAALAHAMSGAAAGSKPVSLAEVRAVLDKLRAADVKRRKKMGVDPSRIDVIYAGTAILEGVMRKLRVEEMQVTTRGLRDGLMADLVRRVMRPPAAGLHEENAVVEGLRAFGRRCGYREPHAEQVAQLSLSLFDQLRQVHRLGAEERGLLHAAALLHDVGTFVSYNRHHKHSYYLLFYADLPGFTDRERELIATIARYHRRSVPKERHDVVQILTPGERLVVRRLAAILRVADGLDRGHRRQVRRLEVSRRGPALRIDVWAEKGADLEVWSAQQKADLLAEVSGGPVRFHLHVVSARR